ncbi:hypothetical protein L596_016447 [Steinernema carpocapsae]|uniref:Uncharacterized protein n=1 Tax=Steinernema carpocapsae TaxID=34508 RepID=A0A4U5NI00_STECR|nr:hypothetical protein L596_016447 [Steinernema carpocapsae]
MLWEVVSMRNAILRPLGEKSVAGSSSAVIHWSISQDLPPWPGWQVHTAPFGSVEANAFLAVFSLPFEGAEALFVNHDASVQASIWRNERGLVLNANGVSRTLDRSSKLASDVHREVEVLFRMSASEGREIDFVEASVAPDSVGGEHKFLLVVVGSPNDEFSVDAFWSRVIGRVEVLGGSESFEMHDQRRRYVVVRLPEKGVCFQLPPGVQAQNRR